MPPKRAVNFTKTELGAIAWPDDGQVYYYDERTPGLCLLFTPNGPQGYYLLRRINGRSKRTNLGRYADITPQQARQEAAKAAGEIARGTDPAEDKRRLRASVTFEALFSNYLEHHAKPRKRTWQEDQRKYDKHFARLANRRVNQIKTADIRRLHNEMKEKNGLYAANRALALLRVVFNHGRRQGMDIANPCDGIDYFKEQSRKRYMDAAELARFLDALDAEPKRDMRDIFALLLWTGARKSNVCAMRWADVDFDGEVWRIPAAEAKGGEELEVILVPQALEILRERRERAGGDDKHVFPADSKVGHITDPKKTWANVMKRAGIDGLHIHDLRRTFGSWQAAGGASLAIIGKSLGHRDTATTEVYARLNLDPVRESVTASTAAMQAAVEYIRKKAREQKQEGEAE